MNVALSLALNRWSKEFFDALQMRDTAVLAHSVLQLGGLAAGASLAAVATLQMRMRLQLTWRLWLTQTLAQRWRAKGTRGDFFADNPVDNPEARLAEDGRLAIELFVDLAGGIINIFLISTSFIIVLWRVGGSYTIFGVTAPGYLVIAVLLYASATSFLMWVMVRPLVASVEAKAAAEGDFRYALTLTRGGLEAGYGGAAGDDPEHDFVGLLKRLERRWLGVIKGQTRIVSLTSANNILAPILPLVLGAPKYLSGAITLGDLMQAAAAFLQVQLSLNWLADNALALANWSASARRVAALDQAIDT